MISLTSASWHPIETSKLISYGLPSSLRRSTHRIRHGQNIVIALSKGKANLDRNVMKLSEGKAINSQGQPTFI